MDSFCRFFFFFFNDTAPTEIYSLPLHDALPIFPAAVPDRPAVAAADLRRRGLRRPAGGAGHAGLRADRPVRDRKSTRLNSSHANISYAVFCLKKNNLSQHIAPMIHT